MSIGGKDYYVFENAFLNLGKNRGRNVLQGVMILVVITAAVVALSIYNTSAVIVDEYKMRFASEALITPERLPSSLPELTEDQAIFYAESAYVRYMDFTESASGRTYIFHLDSPNSLDDFTAEVGAKGLADGYVVRIDKAAYDRMVTPLAGLKDISFTFLWIVLLLGAAVMVLLSAIVIRERKYEIGVLRAMGMKKRKLAQGLWLEIIMLTCICTLLGMFLGGLLSQPVSDALLAGQQASGSVNISVSPLTALQIFGVGLLLASIAGFVSVTRIMKYEPIKILMERG